MNARNTFLHIITVILVATMLAACGPKPAEAPSDATPTVMVNAGSPTISPTVTAGNPVSNSNPTATPNLVSVSPSMQLMLEDMGLTNQFGVRTTATPVPGAGPSLPVPPAMPAMIQNGDAFDFLRSYIEEYRSYAVAHGITPSLYDVADHIIVWIYTTERGGSGKCDVPGDGTSKWFNANLEDCDGLNLVVKDSQVFVMAELNDSRVDNSACEATPFYNGSTMGRWGLWLVTGTCNLTTGLVFVPDGANYVVDSAVLK